MTKKTATERPQHDRIVAALTAKRSPLRARGTAALIDAILDQPLRAFVHVDDVVAIALDAATGANTTRTIERHLRPGWERYVARCRASGETVGDAVPADARRRLARLVTETRLPKARWTKDLVDPKLLRQLLAPVVQQMLVNFAKGLPIPGLAGSAAHTGTGDSSSRSGFGLRDRLKAEVERRAEKVVEASRSVLGGLSAEVERQLTAAARDFSESASREFRHALDARLRSEDGRRLVGQIVAQALDGLWRTRLADLNEDVDALPWDDLWGLAPLLAEHNRARQAVQDALRAELAALLEIDGARTLRALLAEADLLDATAAQLQRDADPIARELFASHAFGAWLDELLAL